MRPYFVASLALSCVLVGAFPAKSEAHQGPWAHFGVGYEVTQAKFSGGALGPDAGNVPYTGHGERVGHVALSIGAGYDFSLSDRWNVGIGSQWFPLGGRKGRTEIRYTTTSEGWYRKDRAWTLFLAPGRAIDADRLIYAKLGYVRGVINSSGAMTRDRLGGPLLGAGYRQLLGKALFGFAEFNYARDRSQSIGSNGATGSSWGHLVNGMIGLGCRF